MPGFNPDKEFRSLLASTGESAERAPSSLKARLYTSLVRRQQESGPLSSLDDSVASGHGICVFEKLVQISPLGDKVTVVRDLDALVTQIAAESRPGDHVLVMSNGGFGGIHEKLLKALSGR